MVNELIFAITIVIVFSYTLISFHLGRRYLYAAIAVNLILIGFFGTELISLFGGVTNVGNVFYVAVFFIGQLLVEHYGKREGMQSIWIGLLAVSFVILMGEFTVHLVPIPESIKSAEVLSALFETTPRVALASLSAYFISQSVNVNLYSYLTNIGPRTIWFRSISSILVGQFLDSIIFFSVAFWGIIPAGILAITAITGFAVKAAVGALSIPFIYFSYKLRTRREILEEESEAILAGIGEGFFATDRNGVILIANRMFEELTGWKVQEVVGKRVEDVVKQEWEEGGVLPFKEWVLSDVLEGKVVSTSMTNHIYFVRKDGGRFPVKSMVTPIRVDNKIMGAIELFEDITAEKQLEKMHKDFLSLASHQLRTPLSGTRWVIETLQKGVVGKMNKKQKEYINELYLVNSQMIKLASDTLQILRLSGGGMKITKERFSVGHLCKDITKTLIAAAQAKKIFFKIGRECKSIFVESDFTMVRNIVEAFISNAINYSHSGGAISVDARESKEEIVISVKDDGIGIPKDEKNRIFERFYRASNAKLVKADGTGLGLSISQMIAERIDARITFESQENKGSTFSLHMPK